jgi:hypothetical protein
MFEEPLLLLQRQERVPVLRKNGIASNHFM